jgi:hypothetical protein
LKRLEARGLGARLEQSPTEVLRRGILTRILRGLEAQGLGAHLEARAPDARVEGFEQYPTEFLRREIPARILRS